MTKLPRETIMYLQNKFNFSDIHRSMNAMGLGQSKWRPKGIMFTLHRTHCLHTLMNVRKMKFISYIYTSFLHRFCCLFVMFWCKSCRVSGEESYKPTCLVITFNSHLHDVNWTLHRPINYFIYLWRPLHVMSCEPLFIGAWTSLVQNRFIQRKSMASVNIYMYSAHSIFKGVLRVDRQAHVFMAITIISATSLS